MTTLTNLQCGNSLNPIQLSPVTRLDLIKYAGASGDYNPIHTIDDVITLKGELVEKNEDVLTFDVAAQNQEGGVAIKGSVKFKLY